MNRRIFTSHGTAGILFAAAHTAWSKEAVFPFLALGACSNLSNAAAIKAAGGEYVEESVKRFLVPDKPESEWAKKRKEALSCPLPTPSCNSFLPGSLKSTGPDANHEAVLNYAETAFKRASQVGVEIIVFGSGGSRQLPEGFPVEKANEQFVALLKKMGPLAQTHGVTVVVEPLRRQECNFINTVVEGASIVEKTNHPHVRLLFDVYHMLQNGEDPNDLRTVGHLLAHGHIAEKEKRSAPGVAGDDFRPFFAALKHIGYQGRISIEGRWKNEDLPNAYKVIREQAREA